MVVGERPIDDTEHFSPLKKKLQHLGSWVVRKASGTDIPDAPSGFRAYSRSTAMRLNVINEYTYTLETIVQAGHDKMAITSVPISTNPELRKSRLFHSMFGYVKRSSVTILRAYTMYSPMATFMRIAAVFGVIGLIFGIYYLVERAMGRGQGHVQLLIFVAIMIFIAAMSVMIGLLADIIAGNRRILQEIQYELRRLDYGPGHEEQKQGHKKEVVNTERKDVETP